MLGGDKYFFENKDMLRWDMYILLILLFVFSWCFVKQETVPQADTQQIPEEPENKESQPESSQETQEEVIEVKEIIEIAPESDIAPSSSQWWEQTQEISTWDNETQWQEIEYTQEDIQASEADLEALFDDILNEE